jgi:hypothetical protein
MGGSGRYAAASHVHERCAPALCGSLSYESYGHRLTHTCSSGPQANDRGKFVLHRVGCEKELDGLHGHAGVAVVRKMNEAGTFSPKEDMAWLVSSRKLDGLRWKS